jgi:hypothetical protein
MNPYDFSPSESQCFITSHNLFNARSEKAFNELLKVLRRLKVDSVWMVPVATTRHNGKSIYDKNVASLILDGDYYEGKFHDLHKTRTTFFTDDDGTFCMLIAFLIFIGNPKTIFDDEKFAEFPPLRTMPHKNNAFSFVIITRMPHIDTMAAKLLMD